MQGLPFPRILLCLVALCVGVVSWVIPMEKIAAPPDEAGPTSPFLLESTAVRGWITGPVAHVEVTQVWTNPNTTPVDGLYIFPLPENAAVTDMKLTIGQRVVQGEMRRREEARRIFEEARREGRIAGLLPAGVRRSATPGRSSPGAAGRFRPGLSGRATGRSRVSRSRGVLLSAVRVTAGSGAGACATRRRALVSSRPMVCSRRGVVRQHEAGSQGRMSDVRSSTGSHSEGNRERGVRVGPASSHPHVDDGRVLTR
mgnify:CR=1 FL=1